MKIFFDLDGVFANFETAYAKHIGTHYWDRRNDDPWPILEQIPRLFYTLDVMPGSVKLFNEVMDRHGEDKVEILTAIPQPTKELATAAKDKEAWVAEFLHPTVTVNTVIGGKNKYKWLEQHPGALLIDDYVRNIELWIENGGVGIVHTDPDSTIEKLRQINIL